MFITNSYSCEHIKILDFFRTRVIRASLFEKGRDECTLILAELDFRIFALTILPEVLAPQRKCRLRSRCSLSFRTISCRNSNSAASNLANFVAGNTALNFS